jgi:hypothetical protein
MVDNTKPISILAKTLIEESLRDKKKLNYLSYVSSTPQYLQIPYIQFE